MDDTKARIINAAIKGVRIYGLEGVRIQNISKLAGLSQGALYRYFASKEELILASFTYVDMQIASMIDEVVLDIDVVKSDPMEAVRKLWTPYFRFWVTHPDETIFYHRFRDSEMYPAHNKVRDVSYFEKFIGLIKAFYEAYPTLRQLSADLLWMHTLTGTVHYAKNVVEGQLPNTEETEEEIFSLMMSGLGPYLTA